MKAHEILSIFAANRLNEKTNNVAFPNGFTKGDYNICYTSITGRKLKNSILVFIMPENIK